jgi:hypothetical protein
MVTGAFVYFFFGAAYLVICGLCQLILKNNEFAVFHLWRNPGFKPRWEDLSFVSANNSFVSDAASDASPRQSMSPRLSPKAKPVDRKETLSEVT